MSGVELPEGWALVLNDFSNDEEPAFSLELQQALMGREGLAFYTNDTSGMSVIFGRRSGQEDWSVLFDPQKENGSLVTMGEPPAGFAPILDAARTTRGNDGGVARLYDVPAALGQALIGFRHDQPPPQPYVILRKKMLGFL